MLIKYYFKQQSKLLVLIVLVLALLNVLTIVMKDDITWGYYTMLYCILPVVFTANIFSREIENKTDFLIFTSRTPKYIILIKKFLCNWLAIEALISLLYIIAFAFGLETSFKKLLSIFIYSTILSLVGLIAALISKKTLIGYGIPIGIWTAQMLAGTRWSQEHSLISVVINIFLDTSVWSNLLFLGALIVPLAMFCVFIVSKGENGRKNIILVGTAFSIIIISLNLFAYNSKLKYYEFWKDTKWKNLSNGNIELKYKGFTKENANKISNIAKEQVNVYNDLFKDQVCYDKFYLWFGKEDELESNSKNVYKINTDFLHDFEKVGNGGKDWPLEVTYSILEPNFKNIKDYKLREQWMTYLFQIYALPELKTKYEQQIWTKPYNYDIHDKEECIKTWEGLIDKAEYKKRDVYEVGKAVLYNLDKTDHENMIKVLREIGNSSKELSNEDIKKICMKYYAETYINKLFASYERAISLGSKIVEYQVME
ncbi:ABC transporter permease [Clostridium lundense]|uniref:ABC transporter permease n=1 Tax=Clostridium lundense TaxID=319475 RepID=UPI000483117F|nr:Yip1 family protein [Clostridium lundense]